MSRSAGIVACCLVLLAPLAVCAAGPDASFESHVKPFLQKHCYDCHGKDAQEGELAFHELTGVDPNNALLWQRIWEQVSLKQMPPKDHGEQPDLMTRWRLSQWITGQLAVALRDQGGFKSHLLPAKGNHLDHALLFGKLPAGLEPPSTPARIWRIHPQEHLVRLNDLICREPAYNPARPGLRTRGDAIPPNELGEIKVYYGLDQVIGWVGGTAAYAAAITGFPPVLSTADQHGLRNYSVQYSVNGAEATQITNHAADILRFMAFGPKAEPYQFADNVNEIDVKYKHESLRGLSQSLFYSKEHKRPLTPVYDLLREPEITDKNLHAAVNFLFESLTLRPPTPRETETYVRLARQAIDELGKEEGAILGLTPIFLDRDALFRPELADYGTPDAHGRVMLQDHELALAINGAFCYLAPDKSLTQAVAEGRMKTRADVQREVARILADDSIRKPRVLQFFREYFDYDRAGTVCKDAKALSSAGGEAKGYYPTMFAMTASTDRLIELILAEDKDVLRELLTTDRAVVNAGADARYYGEFTGPKAAKPQAPPEETPAPPNAKAAAKKKGPQPPSLVQPANFPKGEKTDVRVALVIKPYKTDRLLTTLPTEQRRGILTHPSWLVSHSDAMDNHAIIRGRWIRERLLGDAVPDVPITVDAMLPDEPQSTLRERMRVTREEYCWKCHQKMDPLGLPFQMYNHLGMYRTQELGKPVDTTGEIIDSGEPGLDGPVANALELIDKLAQSERVKQVFVRHAFRYWLGRNETLEDAPVLQDAYHAYESNGGSMKALIASLVTSDAFLYRKVARSGSPPASR